MLASRVFDSDDQARFAALTGDYNPIHMDPIAARRTQAGAPIVHGIHTTLWLLDTIAAHHPEIPGIATLDVSYPEMIYVGDQVEAEVIKLSAESLRVRASVGGLEAVRITATLAAASPPSSGRGTNLTPMPSQAMTPRDLSLSDMAGQHGKVRIAASAMQKQFPHAARLLGPDRLAALGCSSYIVGMIVPGLHSLYVGLKLRVVAATERDELAFDVQSVDPRIRQVILGINGGGLSGSIETFSRLPPVAQPSTAAIASSVSSHEFDGAVALVVGASRGLGEVTAKIIAAGGGRVILTYASGKSDAERVAEDIGNWGGRCDLISYDIREDAYRQMSGLREPPTHYYYFATPAIARRKSNVFVPERFDQFNEYYVYGFQRLVEAGLRLRPGGIAVFYPSTTYVQNRPAKLTEYAMSKAAGEILCSDISKYRRGIRILTHRIPRVSTDQTASIVPVETSDALSVMLPIVRRMHATDKTGE
jgi:acyl dehydratase/NAD(P)-dependent dehydrogenase (short-subunit alcohol dehydrogenase family)